MRDIFSDIYDRVLSFFTSSTQEETKDLAKNRLKSVLAQDRVGFSERAMQMLKDDMIDVISKYLEIDTEAFDLSLDADDIATILNFSIPVLRPKTDEEIDEALTIARQTTLEKTHEIVGELKELVEEKAQELAQNMIEEVDEEESQPQSTAQGEQQSLDIADAQNAAPKKKRKRRKKQNPQSPQQTEQPIE